MNGLCVCEKGIRPNSIPGFLHKQHNFAALIGALSVRLIQFGQKLKSLKMIG